MAEGRDIPFGTRPSALEFIQVGPRLKVTLPFGSPSLLHASKAENVPAPS